MNAGFKLWQAQKAAGTGLCIGLDAHITKELLDAYKHFQHSSHAERAISLMYHSKTEEPSASMMIAGIWAYFLTIVFSAWKNGIRVFKPNIAFYEGLGVNGMLMLSDLCQTIRYLEKGSNSAAFIILDAKRGDIDTTQLPYYQAYLSGFDKTDLLGRAGQYDFDTMTVNIYMGEDVLTPGIEFFQNEKGGIIVTRTSNPSGTQFEDNLFRYNLIRELTRKQEGFRLDELNDKVREILGNAPTFAQMVTYITEYFSQKNNLDENGISPLFNVIGSTMPDDGTFRKLRPNGIALIPGFGAQRGRFENIMSLAIKEGPLAGHVGILSSSRGHNYPWLKKYEGSGDPDNLGSDLAKAIDAFKKSEKQAYQEAGIDWPY